MADSKWKLSGGIGAPTEDVQVMTQGVGFPLRPVGGVPEDEGVLVDLPVAQGVFTQWMGNYQPGLVYPAGSIVRDGDWLMIANKATIDKAAPQPSGNPTWSLGDTPPFVTQSEVAVVYSGHTYTFLEDGWVKGWRVWVPELTATTNYRLLAVNITDPNRLRTVIFEEPVLTENGWQIVALVDRVVRAGDAWRLFIDALNSGTDTQVTGGWTYNGPENTLGPAVGGWNNRNQQDTIRISKTDLDATDRTTELQGMIPGTGVTFSETLKPEFSASYRIIGAPVDGGTYLSYAVELTGSGAGGTPTAGQTTTMVADVPVAQTTKYSEITTGVPTPAWATIESFLEFDGVDQSEATNTYGIDLNFDPAIVSPDWDVLSYHGL